MPDRSGTTCPACKSEGALEIERVRAFRIVRCPSCDLEFSDPMSYSADLYDSAYGNSAGGHPSGESVGVDYKGWLDEVSGFAYRERAFRLPLYRRIVLRDVQCAALAWLRRNVTPGSPVIDIGFGTGVFLTALRSCGFAPIGIDVARAACEKARAAGFEVHAGTIEDYPSEMRPPSAITFFEVLEHLPDPLGFLAGIRRRFPAAPILFSVPSPRRVGLLRGREGWDYPPHHLTRWSEKALATALHSAGYSHVSIGFLPPAPTDVTGTGLGRFLGRRAGKRGDDRMETPAAAGTPGSSWPTRRAVLWLGKAVLFSPVIAVRYLQGFSSTSMWVVAEGKGG